VVGVGGAGRHMACQMPGTKLTVCQEGDVGVPGHGQVSLRKSEVAVARTSSPTALHASDLPWKARLVDAVGRPDVLFLFSGLGGEMGSCLSPLIAELAHFKTLTFASVCLPFSVEGVGRRSMAKEGLARLRGAADLVAVYANDPLIKLAPNLPLGKAFGVMDRIMLSLPMEMCQCLTAEALHLLKDSLARRELRAGIGYGTGLEKERLAVEEALTSPWFPSAEFVPETAFLLISQGEVDRPSVEVCVREMSQALPVRRLLYTSHVDPSIGGKVKVSLLLSYKF
jgi:cell division GTPase FtsZ